MTRHPEELIELAAKLQKPMETYLKWKEVCDRYDRGKNSVLGAIFARLRGLPDLPKSAEQLKILAYADEEYTAYLKKWDSAQKEKIKAQVSYENLLNNFNALQSYFAFEREAMRRNI